MSRSKLHRLSLCLERLEDRLAPAQFNWVGLGDGTSWFDPHNWNNAGNTILPGTNDDVVINISGATVRYSGASTNVHSITNDDTLDVTGDSLTTSGGLVSNGTLTVDGGTLTANGGITVSGGTLNFNGGTIGGTATLTNAALSIGVGASGTETFVVRGSSRLSGTLASSQTIWVQGSDAGGNTTLTTTEGAVNQGTILLQSINQGYTSSLSIGGSSFVNASSGIITVNGGSGGTRSISGHLVNQGTVNANTFLTFTGIYTSAGGTLNGSVYLVNAQIEETAAPTSPTTLVLWGKSTLTTDNLANTTLWVQGSDGGGNATMTSATGFTNAGTIRLESVNQGYSDTLAVSSGTLTTAAGGIILVNNDTGGGRVISGNVFNQGTITVNAGTTLTVSRTGGPSFTQVPERLPAAASSTSLAASSTSTVVQLLEPRCSTARR